MNTLSYRTTSANKTDIKKDWLLVDAENQVLGRLSSKVAKIIIGKHKVYYTPHINCGDKVIIINAEKIRLTGKKIDNKEYVRYTGYPGGQKFTKAKDLLSKNPTLLLEKAIKRMLPKNRLGRAIFKNLYIYSGSNHPHQAQKPKLINLNTI